MEWGSNRAGATIQNELDESSSLFLTFPSEHLLADTIPLTASYQSDSLRMEFVEFLNFNSADGVMETDRFYFPLLLCS